MKKSAQRNDKRRALGLRKVQTVSLPKWTKRFAVRNALKLTYPGRLLEQQALRERGYLIVLHSYDPKFQGWYRRQLTKR